VGSNAKHAEGTTKQNGPQGFAADREQKSFDFQPAKTVERLPRTTDAVGTFQFAFLKWFQWYYFPTRSTGLKI